MTEKVKKILLIVLCIVTSGSLLLVSNAAGATEEQKLIAVFDGEAYDRFGYSVSVYGDIAVISAVTDDGGKGSAYVFNRSSGIWTQQAKLTASDGEASDDFGYFVSVYGDTAVIGAVLDDGGKGSAYVFNRSGGTWTQQAKLTASDGGTGDFFGQTVSVYGDTAVIGAPNDDYAKGSAYVFNRSGGTWTQQAKLTASDGEAYDRFGVSVSVYSDTAVIGARHDDYSKGSAYVFNRSGGTWTQQAKLTASDGTANDWFGDPVSVYGDTTVIGAAYDEGHKGSAYVFNRSSGTWTQQAKLTANDGEAYDIFGGSVSVYSDTAVISALTDDSGKGSAYVFTRSSGAWTQQAKLTASDGEANDYFGYSVSVYGNTAVISAPFDDGWKGSAYVFSLGDSTPPTIECGSADGLWHKTDVSIACTASDSGSGLANLDDSHFSLSTNVASGEETINAVTDSHIVCDLAENCATAGPISGNMVDKKSPSISILVPITAGTYMLNQAIAASYSCSDGGSGVVNCEGSVPNGNDFDTNIIGSKSFTVTATDVAGNTASANNNYNVIYNFKGFFQPVDIIPTLNTVKAGSSIPMKFSLNGNQGFNIFTTSYPKSQTISCDTSAPLDEIDETETAGQSSLSYDATADQYNYVWKTDKAWSGTCRQMIIRLNDGTDNMANFKFR